MRSVVSETRPGDVFSFPGLAGMAPWEHLGSIQVATNEFSRLGRMSNVSIMVHPGGNCHDRAALRGYSR